MRDFKLYPAFLKDYEGKQPDWGPLGYVVYKRTYSRLKEDGSHEEYWETVKRVVEGVYSIQKQHCRDLGLPWNNSKSHRSAQEMFQRIWEFKFTPPGRGLWMMGTDYIDKIKSSAPLQNCAFVTTENIKQAIDQPFTWSMDMLMLGVGVGFDTLGAGTFEVQEPKRGDVVFAVQDSREGWVDAFKRVLRAYQGYKSLPAKFDYSLIRAEGAIIKGFGGTSSGYKPLKLLIESTIELLDARVGGTLSSVDISDLFCMVGRCVVAGNVRRSALLAMGDPNDSAFADMKNPALFDKENKAIRWASNNSLSATIGMDYTEAAASTAANGEPGFVWLENMRKYSRMKDPADFKDAKAMGVNPCFSGDTRVAVADGRNVVTLKQLADEGWALPVYCWDKNKHTYTREGRSPRKTGVRSLYRITFEDNTYIDATTNHVWPLMDGGLVLTKGLTSNTKLAGAYFEVGDSPGPAELKPARVVKSVVELPGKHDVYNITVDEFHTYAVIPNGVDVTKSYSGVFTNNCGETTLNNLELCNLVETFPARHESFKDYKRTLKYAYLYAKSVTLLPTHSEATNAVVMMNRRIGCSMSGITQAMTKLGTRMFYEWADHGYEYIQKQDQVYSSWLCVPRSIKTTVVKPSGSVSLLCGATPGIHFPHSEFYIRRVRFQESSPIASALKLCGHTVEVDKYSPNTVVIEFPVQEEYFTKGKKSVTMWEQLELAAQMQAYWADNQVSATVTFSKDEAKDLPTALSLYEARLKSISFLPLEDHAYEQAPYEAITEDQYNEMIAKIDDSNLPAMLRATDSLHDKTEKFCTTDKCDIEFDKQEK